MATQHDKFPPYDVILNDDIVDYYNKKWMYVADGANNRGWYSSFDGRLPDTTLNSTEFNPHKPVQKVDATDGGSGLRSVDHYIDLNTIDEIPDTPQP